MKFLKDNILYVAIATILTATIIGGLLIIFGSGNQNNDKHVVTKPVITATKPQPVAVQQPPSALAVANSLHCTDFKDLGPSQIGGVLDSGSCMKNGKKYAIDTFQSKDIRNIWLKTAVQLGVDPQWETDNSVIYPSVP